MTLPNTFSRRNGLLNRQDPDVFIYDKIEQKVRTQFLQIIVACFGDYDLYTNSSTNRVWIELRDTMREEKGVDALSRDTHNPEMELRSWVNMEGDTRLLIDFFDLSLRLMDSRVRNNQISFTGKKSADFSIKKVNSRFMEAGFGYQFENKVLLKISSTLLHQEVLIPALILISDPKFQAVDTEFRKAHEAFRGADYESSLIECAKAFESTFKILGSERGWPNSTNLSSSKLVDLAFSQNFIPTWMQTSFSALRALLESAVPTPRNRVAGHGAGTVPRTVTQELAALQIYQTAAVIQFLVTHHKNNP